MENYEGSQESVLHAPTLELLDVSRSCNLAPLLSSTLLYFSLSVGVILHETCSETQREAQTLAPDQLDWSCCNNPKKAVFHFNMEESLRHPCDESDDKLNTTDDEDDGDVYLDSSSYDFNKTGVDSTFAFSSGVASAAASTDSLFDAKLLSNTSSLDSLFDDHPSVTSSPDSLFHEPMSDASSADSLFDEHPSITSSPDSLIDELPSVGFMSKSTVAKWRKDQQDLWRFGPHMKWSAFRSGNFYAHCPDQASASAERSKGCRQEKKVATRKSCKAATSEGDKKSQLFVNKGSKNAKKQTSERSKRAEAVQTLYELKEELKGRHFQDDVYKMISTFEGIYGQVTVALEGELNDYARQQLEALDILHKALSRAELEQATNIVPAQGAEAMVTETASKLSGSGEILVKEKAKSDEVPNEVPEKTKTAEQELEVEQVESPIAQDVKGDSKTEDPPEDDLAWKAQRSKPAHASTEGRLDLVPTTPMRERESTLRQKDTSETSQPWALQLKANRALQIPMILILILRKTMVQGEKFPQRKKVVASTEDSSDSDPEDPDSETDNDSDSDDPNSEEGSSEDGLAKKKESSGGDSSTEDSDSEPSSDEAGDAQGGTNTVLKVGLPRGVKWQTPEVEQGGEAKRKKTDNGEQMDSFDKPPMRLVQPEDIKFLEVQVLALKEQEQRAANLKRKPSGDLWHGRLQLLKRRQHKLKKSKGAKSRTVRQRCNSPKFISDSENDSMAADSEDYEPLKTSGKTLSDEDEEPADSQAIGFANGEFNEAMEGGGLVAVVRSNANGLKKPKTSSDEPAKNSASEPGKKEEEESGVIINAALKLEPAKAKMPARAEKPARAPCGQRPLDTHLESWEDGVDYAAPKSKKKIVFSLAQVTGKSLGIDTRMWWTRVPDLCAEAARMTYKLLVALVTSTRGEAGGEPTALYKKYQLTGLSGPRQMKSADDEDVPSREPGYMSCGCDEHPALLEWMLWKEGLIHATLCNDEGDKDKLCEGWHGPYAAEDLEGLDFMDLFIHDDNGLPIPDHEHRNLTLRIKALSVRKQILEKEALEKNSAFGVAAKFEKEQRAKDNAMKVKLEKKADNERRERKVRRKEKRKIHKLEAAAAADAPSNAIATSSKFS
ncbi:hypothetical protein C8J56DRAFT_894340 [Mycena floridula]|nr:hypothetical protein C8J56DRAFT_894340 [Mycena floridula]